MSNTTTTYSDDRAMTRGEVAERYGLGVHYVSVAMRNKQLRTIRIGRGRTARWVTWPRWVAEWIERGAPVDAPTTASSSRTLRDLPATV